MWRRCKTTTYYVPSSQRRRNLRRQTVLTCWLRCQIVSRWWFRLQIVSSWWFRRQMPSRFFFSFNDGRILVDTTLPTVHFGSELSSDYISIIIINNILIILGFAPYKYFMVTWFTNFRKITTGYRRIGYNLNVKRQSACLYLTQSWLITILPSLIARRRVGRQTL